MFVLHIALQGCLRGSNVEYGRTADTGGHIRYLLDLVAACERDRPTGRTVIATRHFSGPAWNDYAAFRETVSASTEIVRLPTRSRGYLAKEDLHTELDSFADALGRFIAEQDGAPDMLHAHYADAGIVAGIVGKRLNIPYVFTAHSLGRVKQACGGARADCPKLARRIAAEEKAVRDAALVVASSRDEAEVQYAGYRNGDPGRIRILPPGSDLERFKDAASSPAVDKAIDRFLRDPGKPAILALARPVARKNLAALVEAFGASAELRERANLVIVAGTRDDLSDLDGDMADTMRDLLCLIDRHDLYGSVAYPKTHKPDEVPAFYAYARERGGVFVNPALNEPFGLTLLEASAAGLPLVATDSGGPNDIIEMCRNGILVDPHSPLAIAEACLRIVGDPALWASFAAAGACAVRAYDWNRHAERYHALVDDLLAPRRPSSRFAQLLVTDIDNTLVGCAERVKAFGEWRGQQSGLGFGVATGRSFHSAMAILEQQNAPRPQVMITSVGSEIYHLDPNGTTYTGDAEWRALISKRWNRDAARAALRDLPGITPQAPLEQRSHKLSFFTTPGDGDAPQRVRARLEAAGLHCSVIHSHGRYLDILPARASKGTAVEFVRQRFGLAQDAVFAAGDSGNDIEMLRTVPQSIIVANFSDGLDRLPDLRHSYVARETFAAGIIEGVRFFRERNGWTREAAASLPASCLPAF